MTQQYSLAFLANTVERSEDFILDWLRTNKVLISEGQMKDVPYQPYMHYFNVTAEFVDGKTAYTTRLQPSGLDLLGAVFGAKANREEWGTLPDGTLMHIERAIAGLSVPA